MSVDKLMAFMEASPTAFHAVDQIKTRLFNNDYVELKEYDSWQIEPGGKYFVTRNDSSIIAFHIGTDLSHYSFNILAAHSDSPTFKVKEKGEHLSAGHYVTLNTEGYGGMILPSWFDRPLSIAGRVIVKEGKALKPYLLTIDRDLVMIPHVAIHMEPGINSGYTYNKQIDMMPLFSGDEGQIGDLKTLVAKTLGVDSSAIYGHDLFLYNRQVPVIWGAHNEFVSSGRLDDLECSFGGLEAIVQSTPKSSINVLAVFDNEEVGSLTKQGAASTFMEDTLERINASLGFERERLFQAVASSLMISADSAHAVHPNHPELTDNENCTYMNQGIVVKSHANQKYASDAVSIAMFKAYAEKAQVPLQYFANRSDKRSGSTIGNLSNTHVSLNTVDIGLPQLAMHSAYETAGVKDIDYLIDLLTVFYNCHLTHCEAGFLIED